MKKLDIPDLVNDQKKALNEKIMRLDEVAHCPKSLKSILYSRMRAPGYLCSDVGDWTESRIKVGGGAA
jgi:hypothetical protein